MMKRACIAIVAISLIFAAGCGSEDSEANNGGFGIEEDVGADDDAGPDGGSGDEDAGDEPVEGVADGEACQSNAECAGGTCITDRQGWPDGYCTTWGCDTRDDCAGGDEHDNACLGGGGHQSLCVRLCTSDSECRDGYFCQPVGGGQAFCAPGDGGGGGGGNVGEIDFEDHPFEITCGLEADGGQLSIDYEIDGGTSSYMVTPISRDGTALSPSSIDLPDDDSISFRGDNDFQAVNAQMFGVINPIVTPAIENYEDQLQSGSHTLRLDTDSEDVCYYKLEESEPGTTIDFNVYLVGVPDISAETAASNADMQAVLDQFESIYGQAGIDIGEVEFHELSGEETEAYQIVRSYSDLYELVSLSERPEGGVDAALSANVFFVESMQLDSRRGGVESGAIGVSLGLPGAAGLHGTPSSGVVFTSEYMGEEETRSSTGEMVDGNKLTGNVLAHEIGHYLGLFHTSEQYGRGYDPLDDTPRCSSTSFPHNCPDLGNLMFPIAGGDHTELSEGQSYVIQANPLTKE